MLLVDLIWIKLVAGKKYKKMIYDIQNEEMKIKMIPALLTYVVMTLLFILFASTDQTNSSNIKNFLLGFLTYGVYDLTNLSLINKFDSVFALADMTWGGFLFMITYKIYSHINPLI